MNGPRPRNGTDRCRGAASCVHDRQPGFFASATEWSAMLVPAKAMTPFGMNSSHGSPCRTGAVRPWRGAANAAGIPVEVRDASDTGPRCPHREHRGEARERPQVLSVGENASSVPYQCSAPPSRKLSSGAGSGRGSPSTPSRSVRPPDSAQAEAGLGPINTIARHP